MSTNQHLADRLFDDFFGEHSIAPLWSGHDPLYGKHGKNLMKTDVRETERGYEVDVDLPGFQKDEITVELRDGYLSIGASKGLDKDQQNEAGSYIRRERYTGSCSRSFYVGDIAPEEISAKYENGILRLTLPKRGKEEQAPKNRIAIQ